MTPSESRSASSEPVRVLHLAAGNLFGGIERMLLAVVGAAASADAHQVALSVDGRLARELRDRGATPHLIGAARFSRPHTLWRARRALAELLASSSIDAVIAHAPWSYALAAPVVRRTRVPLLLWAHDAPNPASFLERRVAARPPDACICNSAYTAGLVAAWLPEVSRTIIHPAVAPQPPLTPGERASVRRELGADGETCVILLAARFEAWKGHRVLLEAAAALRGAFAIWIAGDPQRPHEAAYLDTLMRFAEGTLPHGAVRFLGYRNDVPRVMAAADVYCQPNTSPDPFGVVFAEALAAGTPVVTPAIGGAIEIVNARCGILTVDSSAAATAAALQRLLDDRGLRAALGAEGPAQAARVTDAAARVRQLETVITELRTRRPAA
jgi:glycosyltransferase involved in cell wall biosynthesis